MWDVIVVGLGPAGSTAARVAANRGLKVLAFDGAQFPRHKPCAAGLTGRAQKLIPLPESRYLETAIHRVVITLGVKTPVVVECSERLMVTTKRDILDDALVELAAASGAEICQGNKVKTISEESEHARVISAKGVETARFVIGCDGVHSVVRRALQQKRALFAPALEVEYLLPKDVDANIRSEVRFDLGVHGAGYGWAFPKTQSISVGVAGNFKDRSSIDRAYKTILDRLPGSSQWKSLGRYGHPVPIFNRRVVIGNSRIILAGDAGGLVDPFLGEGIYYALKSGEIAADWVSQNVKNTSTAGQTYQARIMFELGEDLILASRLAGLVYRFPGMMMYLAGKKPEILVRFARNLAGDGGYAEFIKHLPRPWRYLFPRMRRR